VTRSGRLRQATSLREHEAEWRDADDDEDYRYAYMYTPGMTPGGRDPSPDLASACDKPAGFG
jgi:hypothetical protein